MVCEALKKEEEREKGRGDEIGEDHQSWSSIDPAKGVPDILGSSPRVCGGTFLLVSICSLPCIFPCQTFPVVLKIRGNKDTIKTHPIFTDTTVNL